MATVYYKDNGKLKKKKTQDYSTVYYRENGELKSKKVFKTPQNAEKIVEEKTLFQKGSFDDGFDVSDLITAPIATVADAGVDILKGAGRLVEGVVDLGGYGVAEVADLFGADKFADKTRKKMQVDTVGKMTKGIDEKLDKYSLLGYYGDAVAEGFGQIATIILTGGAAAGSLGALGATALTSGLMGASSMGSGIGEAYQGGATDGQAWGYGAMKGAVDMASEWIFGGLGKGVKALGLGKGLTSIDDVFARKVSGLVTKHLGNKTAQKVLGNTVEYAIKSGAEGLEEVLAGIGTAYAKKFSYMSDKDINELKKDENLLEQFIVGSLTSAIAQGGDMFRAQTKGQDFITGRTASEQKVIDNEVNRIIEERKKNGEKVKKSEIYEDVENNLKKGYIGTDTIESIIGEKAYSEYKKASDTERAETERLNKEISSLEDKINFSEDISSEDREKLSSLRSELESLTNNSKVNELKEKLDAFVRDKVKGTSLAESYNEIARQTEKFKADLSKYTAKEQRIVQKAIDSGILNNTNRSHELVDLIAKLSAHLDIDFDFVNNERLKASGFALEGKTVNGYVTKDGITINTQSPKYLNSVIGHEITHVLKGSELFDSLQSTLFDYAKSRGEYDTRLNTLAETYKGIENVDINEELTADLVGDYIFTDRKFVEHLLNTNRNAFQKIYDEVKYLCKIATTGSKEEKALLKAKKIFDDVYSEGKTNNVEGVRYSLDGKQKRAEELTETDLRHLLEQTQYGTLGDSSYIPLRVSTPDFFINVVKEHSDGKYNVMSVPLASKVEHLRQNMDEDDGASYGDKRPHNLSVDDIVTISKEMGHPSYIVLQNNGRYAMVVSFYNGDNKKVVVSIDFASDVEPIKNYKYQQYMNGYNEGYYNIVVTQYSPDDFSKYLKGCEIIYDKKKMNGRYQVGSGRVVTFTHDTPFINNSISDSDKNVNRKFSLSPIAPEIAPNGTLKITSDDVTLKAPKVEGEAKTENVLDDDIPIRKEPTLTELRAEREDIERRAEEEARKAQDAGDVTEYKKLSERYEELNRLIAEKESRQIKLDEKKLDRVTNYLSRVTKSDVSKDEIRPLLEEIYQDLSNSNYIESDVREKIDSLAYKMAEGVSPPKHVVQDIKDILDDVRKTAIWLSDGQKQELKYKYGKDWYKKFSGKIKTSKDKTHDLASHWQEWSKQFPNFFDENVTDSEMGVALVEAYEKLNEQKYEYEDVNVKYVADWISDEILSQYDNLVPSEADIFPDAVEIENEDFSVRGENQKRLSQLRRELFNDMAMREDAEAMYNKQIEALENSNDGSIDSRREIANLKHLRDDALSKYDARIDSLQSSIERMHSKPFKRAEARKVKREDYFEYFKNTLGDTSGWKDRKLGILDSMNTLRRNLRYIVRDAKGNPDIARADKIYDDLQGKNGYSKNEAILNEESKNLKKPFAELKLTKAEREYSQMLGELKYNKQTELKKEDVAAYLNSHKSSIDESKVDKAIEMARKLYDDLFVRVNEVLSEHGFKEIDYREGYFPHFEAPKQGWLAKLFNWKVKDDSIPTDIAGLTEQFNPERSYQSFNKERKTDKTDYDLYKGLDTYINGALDWIHHIDDIQKRRAFEEYLRYVRSDAGVKERVNAIINDDTLDSDEVRQQLDAVYSEAKSNLGNFVMDLRRGTNTLAGKKSSFDREMEYQTSRKAYQTMTNISSRITGNMVAGSVSAAITNVIPITQSWIQVSPARSVQGMAETIRSYFHDDGTIAKSDFLTNRLAQREELAKDGWDKVSDKVGFLMSAVDNFSAQTIWRSKYNTNIAEGMSEADAIADADQFCKNVMADRSRGDMPTLFDAKNPVAKIFTAFQLEVANQYGYMFHDARQDMKGQVNKLAWGYTKAFLGAYVFNSLVSAISGNTPALDPIRAIVELFQDLGAFDDEEDEEWYKTAQDLGMLKRGTANDSGEAVYNLAENVAQEIPFLGGLMGGGRIPLSSALPFDGDVMEFINAATSGRGKEVAEELLNTLYYTALPFGGGQLRKTIQGASMFLGNKDVTGSYTQNGELRFPVEANVGNVAQALTFGKWSNKNAREYLDRKESPLNDKQLEEFLDSQMPISDYWDYREGLRGKKKAAEKADYISELDLPLSTKNLLINNELNRKVPFDMTDYDGYGSFEEADYAQKDPEKYALISNVFGYDKYQGYKTTLSQIKGENAKSDKAKYIQSLPLKAIQKKILFKSIYPSDHSYDYEIIQYIDSLKISKSEKGKMARALGFEVKE